MKNALLLSLLFLYSFLAQAKTFRVRLTEDLGTLDWNYGELSPEIIYQIMEGLYTTDHLGRPLPAVAEKFQWSANKTKIHFQLRSNIHWSDGEPLCAQHFVDSWNRLQSKEFASPYAHYAKVLKSFSAPSCLSLEVEFKRSTPEALALFSHYVFFPIRLDLLKANPKMFTDGQGLPVNGPYKVDSWVKNQSLVLVRNTNYGDFPDRASIDRIEYQFLPEDSIAFLLFDKMKLDWLKEIPPILRTAQTEARIEFNRYPSLISYYFGLNAKTAPILAEPEIRAALEAALDKKELKKILGIETRIANSWLSQDLFPELRITEEKTYDFTKAKELLTKLGEAKVGALKLVVYNKPIHKTLAEWAQGQWQKKLGITIPVEVQDAKIYWSQMGLKPPAIFLSGVTAAYNHPRAFLQEFLSESTANWTSWTSREYDTLVEQEKFQQAEDMLMKENFIIPLYSRDTVAMVQKQWKGFWINPLGQIFLKTVH